jgi:hypothetical protein
MRRGVFGNHYIKSSHEPTCDFENLAWDNTRMPWPDDYARETRPGRSPIAACGEENPYPLGLFTRDPRRAGAE